MDKEAAQYLYKIATESKMTKKTMDQEALNPLKPKDIKKESKPEENPESLKKAAFDMGFNDALRLASLIKNKK